MNSEDIFHHLPVMVKETIEVLELSPGMRVFEGYMGLGGHSREILGRIGEGHLYGFEIDERIAAQAERNLEIHSGRFTIIRANCRDFDTHLSRLGVEMIDAAVLDLGVGYYHLGEGWGMALKKDLPIDFRLAPSSGIPSGKEIIEEYPEEQLRDLIAGTGESRFAAKVAREIVRHRPVGTTGKLARIIENAIPKKFHKPGISPAQRIFAGIRARVNDEIGVLSDIESKLAYWLRQGGNVACLCYTSAELSHFRKYLKSSGCVCPPGLPECKCGKSYKFGMLEDGRRPGEDELASNPSARSARLIAAKLLRAPAEGRRE